MGFIDKFNSSEPVLSIKLTSEGRKILSQGKFNTLYYALGDSEINYDYLLKTGMLASATSVLKPVDVNPNLLSFLKKNVDDANYYSIDVVNSETITLKNTQAPIGFFTYSGTTASFDKTNPYFLTEAFTENVKLDGGGTLRLTGVTATSGITKNDIVILKLIYKANTITSGTTVTTQPIQYLKYKIKSITVRNDTNKTIEVGVDRGLPNFSSLSSSTTKVGAMILKSEWFTGNTETYDNSDIINATFSDYICPMENFPFWKMSIIFTNEIAGVLGTNKKYFEAKTSIYNGFVSYIQSQQINYKNLGVIHYSNSSPLNTYGESLFEDTPMLDIPTLMWHKSKTPLIGAKFIAYGDEKIITDKDNPLGVRYYDLVDYYNLTGDTVGKVFNDLKLFVIEDQELLFALSYKSNRSYTLPNFNVEIFCSQSYCPSCNIKLNNIIYTSPPTYNGQGSYAFGVSNLSYEANNIVIAEAFSGGTSTSGGTSIYLKRLFLDIPTNKYTLSTPAGTYSRFEIRDIGVPDCVGFLSGLTVTLPTTTTTTTTLLPPTTTTTTLPPVCANLSGSTTVNSDNVIVRYTVNISPAVALTNLTFPITHTNTNNTGTIPNYVTILAGNSTGYVDYVYTRLASTYTIYCSFGTIPIGYYKCIDNIDFLIHPTTVTTTTTTVYVLPDEITSGLDKLVVNTIHSTRLDYTVIVNNGTITDYNCVLRVSGATSSGWVQSNVFTVYNNSANFIQSGTLEMSAINTNGDNFDIGFSTDGGYTWVTVYLDTCAPLTLPYDCFI